MLHLKITVETVYTEEADTHKLYSCKVYKLSLLNSDGLP